MIFRVVSAKAAKTLLDLLYDNKERFYRREGERGPEICSVADHHTVLIAHPFPFWDREAVLWYMWYNAADFQLIDPTNPILSKVAQK